MFNDRFRLTEAVIQGKKIQERRLAKISPSSEVGEVKINQYGTNYVEIIPKSQFDFLSLGDRITAPFSVGEMVAVAMSYEKCQQLMEKGLLLDCQKRADWSQLTQHQGWKNKLFVSAELMPFQIKIKGVSIQHVQDISEDECFCDLPISMVGYKFTLNMVNMTVWITTMDETVDPNAEDVTETPTSESPQTDTTAPTPETQENTNSQVIVPTSQETEVVTEVVDANPYGLTLHNLTAEIIASYNGQFDDKEFLQAVGDTLKVGVNGSPYQAVTDVYFSSENYTGVRESGKVYHYIYFNNNTNWEVLSIYYMSNGEYIFTEVPDETEAPTASNQGSNGSSTSSGGTVVNGGTTTNGGTTSNTTYVQPQTQIVTTSLDILQVSKKFLDYVGQDAFYDAAFQYVLKSGLTGQIQGTMKDYKINEEKGKAVINIDLTNGKSIKGVYLTETKEFSFTGLE